jgi:osmotically-inducible protein OsmY
MAQSPISDKSLLEKVNQRLSRSGSGSKSRVNASIAKGDVTLAGMLQYEIQRMPLVKAVGAVTGVRRVIDQMRVAPAEKKWQQQQQ